MAKALGYVTQNENGNYEGILAMGINERIKIIPNEPKTPKSREPDYRIFGKTLGEVGGAWNRTGKTSGKDYVSITFVHPNISASKLYANLGQNAGGEDNEFAMLWNPKD